MTTMTTESPNPPPPTPRGRNRFATDDSQARRRIWGLLYRATRRVTERVDRQSRDVQSLARRVLDLERRLRHLESTGGPDRPAVTSWVTSGDLRE
jgi:hypothetical protein